MMNYVIVTMMKRSLSLCKFCKRKLNFYFLHVIYNEFRRSHCFILYFVFNILLFESFQYYFLFGSYDPNPTNTVKFSRLFSHNHLFFAITNFTIFIIIIIIILIVKIIISIWIIKIIFIIIKNIDIYLKQYELHRCSYSLFKNVKKWIVSLFKNGKCNKLSS